MFSKRSSEEYSLIWCNIVFGGRKVTEEKVKKSWAVVDAESHQRDDVKRETVYCLNDDDETEVQKDDTIQGAESISYWFYITISDMYGSHEKK